MNQIISKIYPKSKKNLYKSNTLFLKPVLSRLNSGSKPLYFANFLSSIDARIATYDKNHSKLLTPPDIKSNIDFSLFCQLHAQADCLVTNTHYINGLNKGYYGNILSIKDANLQKWRNKNNLKNQKIIILSNSLNFPINKNIENLKDKITILTTSSNDRKILNLRKNNFRVLKCRGKNISAKQLNKYVVENKFKSVYFIAGPTIVEQMISENLLDKLYCSTSMTMMGTEKYDTIIRGNFLKKPVKLKLISMYIYSKNKTQEQTLFQVFDTKRK